MCLKGARNALRNSEHESSADAEQRGTGKCLRSVEVSAVDRRDRTVAQLKRAEVYVLCERVIQAAKDAILEPINVNRTVRRLRAPHAHRDLQVRLESFRHR